jgi:hypothetical protein
MYKTALMFACLICFQSQALKYTYNLYKAILTAESYWYFYGIGLEGFGCLERLGKLRLKNLTISDLDKLTKELSCFQSMSHITHLSILSQKKLTPKYIQKIMTLVECYSIEHLSISHSIIDDQAIEVFCAYLIDTQSLMHVDLSGSTDISADGCKKLFMTLKTQGHISHLYLRDCWIFDKKSTVIWQNLPSSITHLYLGANYGASIDMVIEAIESNTQLKEIELGAAFKDEGILALFSAFWGRDIKLLFNCHRLDLSAYIYHMAGLTLRKHKNHNVTIDLLAIKSKMIEGLQNKLSEIQALEKQMRCADYREQNRLKEDLKKLKTPDVKPKKSNCRTVFGGDIIHFDPSDHKSDYESC